jgi:hypothetical protein
LIGIVATYLLTVAIANGPQTQSGTYRRIGWLLYLAVCVVLLLGLPGGYRLGLSKGQEQMEERRAQREIVLNFEGRSDKELSEVYPKMLRERLIYWKSHNLVPFDQ